MNLHGSETHHVRDLTQELGATPKVNPITKPPAPHGHIIHDQVKSFQNAILNNNLKIYKRSLINSNSSQPPALITSTMTVPNY